VSTRQWERTAVLPTLKDFARILRALLPVLLFSLPGTAVRAQTAAVDGRVTDATGRPVPESVVHLTSADSVTLRTTVTDRLGRFHIAAVPAGRYTLRVERIGHTTAERIIDVSAVTAAPLDITLANAPVQLPGVGAETRRERTTFETSAGATTRVLTREDMKRLPAVAEADVLRAVEILPGVVSTSDYTSAFNVRGGSADQNLILLDGVPIYNPFHLGGLFSVFNADMVGRAELLAGGFPAEYGGRVASVLNVESDATGTGTEVNAGVSLLASRIAVNTPLPAVFAGALGLASARVHASVRRSWFDVLLKPFFEFPYHLTDAQLYAEGWTRGGARVAITAYTGRDVLDFAGVDSFPLRIRWTWGNDVAGARFTAPLGERATLDVRAGITRFTTVTGFPDFADTELSGRITQALVRGDLDVPLSSTLDLGLGVEANRLSYDNLAASGGTRFGGGSDEGWLTGAYMQALWRPHARWLFEAGGRLDAWAPSIGAGVAPASPRLAIKHFFADGNAALKLAVGRYTQFLHSIRDEELPLGIDVWVLSGARAPHVVSDQIQTGIEFFEANGWYGALEAYVRSFDGVATNNFANDPNDDFDDLIGGKGTSYGADLLVRRERGSVRPMLSVSWLRARREFPDPTTGLSPTPLVEYPPVFDRRLDAELVLQFVLPGNSEGGIRWNLGTGLPYTRPLGTYRPYTYELVRDGVRTSDDDAEPAVVLGPRNAERYPAYHRLDFSVRRTFRKSWGTLTPHIEVLNLYNRRNVLFYFYEYDESPARRTGISMFPFLPAIGVDITF